MNVLWTSGILFMYIHKKTMKVFFPLMICMHNNIHICCKTIIKCIKLEDILNCFRLDHKEKIIYHRGMEQTRTVPGKGKNYIHQT